MEYRSGRPCMGEAAHEYPDFSVSWDMPNKNTFEIPSVLKFLKEHIRCHRYGLKREPEICDPFCGESRIAPVRNDIKFSGMDSLEWLKTFPDKTFDIVLFDPPYTPRQLKECYDSLWLSLHDTTSGYWAKLKDEIARISEPNGCVLSFGYGASNVGMKRGFEIYAGHVVLHGGNHNATICMAEHPASGSVSER
jgi:hypothetical protein